MVSNVSRATLAAFALSLVWIGPPVELLDFEVEDGAEAQESDAAEDNESD